MHQYRKKFLLFFLSFVIIFTSIANAENSEVNEILSTIQKDLRIGLGAPTGKASRRLEETINKHVSNIVAAAFSNNIRNLFCLYFL